MPPSMLEAIEKETAELGFDMASERNTGALLRVLAAGKPAGRFLELGTGTGIATAWLLDGMDANSILHTVDIDRDVSALAQRVFGEDPRVRFVFGDAIGWLEGNGELSFDLVFADTNAGKFEQFEVVWERMRPGALYVVDDMLPQRNWPDGHDENVSALLAHLKQRPDCMLVELAWSSGLAVAAKSAH